MEQKEMKSALLSEEDVQLAMVYSPEQPWQELFPAEEALNRGTLFRALCKPLEGGQDGE